VPRYPKLSFGPWEIVAEPRNPYAGPSEEFVSAKHARFIDPRVPYHIICKTLQGFHLLRPDQRLVLRELVAGVIGRAQRNYPGVKLFAAAFLSNHFHLMLQGSSYAVVGFVGFCKREISRRWAPKIGWSGPMWGKYQATAVVTADAQVRCLRYILGHGPKEGIVARPQQWPGFHCAAALLRGRGCVGKWFDATGYGKAMYKESIKNKPRPVRKDAFFITYTVEYAKIPAWQHLDDADYRAAIAGLINEVVTEARAARRGQPPLGAKRLCRTSRMTRGESPQPPWYVLRRRMIAWDDPAAPEVRQLKKRYWEFQQAFRVASDRLLAGELDVAFPPGSFRPCIPQPRGSPNRAAA
jgi:REP element-mobilizing transposase RayT